MNFFKFSKACFLKRLEQQYEFFQVFEGLFLEAPRAVLFHATAIHCHDGMDHDDASVFVLGSELLVCS